MTRSARRAGPGRSTGGSGRGGFPCGSRWRESGPTRQRGPEGARCKGSTVCPTETGGTIALRPPRRSRVRWGTSPPVREAGPVPHRRARTRTRGGSSSPREGGRRSALGLPVRLPYPSPPAEPPHDPRPLHAKRLGVAGLGRLEGRGRGRGRIGRGGSPRDSPRERGWAHSLGQPMVSGEVRLIPPERSTRGREPSRVERRAEPTRWPSLVHGYREAKSRAGRRGSRGTSPVRSREPPRSGFLGARNPCGGSPIGSLGIPS